MLSVRAAVSKDLPGAGCSASTRTRVTWAGGVSSSPHRHFHGTAHKMASREPVIQGKEKMRAREHVRGPWPRDARCGHVMTFSWK